MTEEEMDDKKISDEIWSECYRMNTDGAPMNAARRAMELPELPDKSLQIEAPKIERELEMIRKELHQIKVVLKMGLKVCEEDGGDTE